MSLLKKSLLFLLVILALQLALFSFLGLALMDAEKQVDKLAYSHRVVSGRDRISHAFYEAMQTTMLMAMTMNEALGKRLDEIATELPKTIKEMEISEYASDEDRRDLSTISKITVYILDELRYLRNSITKSDSPDRFRKALRFINLQVNPHLEDLNEAMTSLEKRHRAIERNSAATHKFRNVIHNIIAAGFVGSIAATVAIVTAFILGVSNRIKVVNDNVLRHAAGKPLLPQHRGNDEINKLDSHFHILSRSLAEAKAKDDAVFTNMPVGLVTCLEDGTVEDLNPRAENLFGVSVRRGLNVQALLSDGTADGGILKTLDESGPGESRRLRWKRTDGTEFPAEVSIAKFTLDGKNRSLLALLDVSDREHIENLRQEFVSIVSHDIGSPLSSISACLTLFSQGTFGPVTEKAQHRLNVAEKECARLMRLTKDLLDMARIESGNVHLDKLPCQVQNLIETSINAVHLGSVDKGIAFVAEPTDLEVVADPDRVTQIIVNFLSNAVKYTPAGKCIFLSAERDEDAVRINVRDEGPGIPEALQKQIFERFRQVDKEDSKRGTGLGLAVCRMLAEAHGGAVGVYCEPGKCSTFWLRLPTQ